MDPKIAAKQKMLLRLTQLVDPLKAKKAEGVHTAQPTTRNNHTTEGSLSGLKTLKASSILQNQTKTERLASQLKGPRLATENDMGSKERFDLTLDSNDPNPNYNHEIPSEHLVNLQTSIQTHHLSDQTHDKTPGPSMGPKFA